MKIGQVIRQGDVFVERIASIPENVKPVARDRGRIVLAYGEVTGHAHAITEDWVELLETEANERYLRVQKQQATLVHEEHTQHALPPGEYRVTIQREYHPEAIRNVSD